jgi:AcrR family transcriptional regulator
MRTGLPPGSGEDGGTGWKERAVERSLRSARERAVSRSERFIHVATELLYETGSLEFTVQELVERSRLSLRSFYQHFASKEDLLLAVFEEAIRGYVEGLRATVESLGAPSERLHAYVTSFYAAGQGRNQPASQALSRYLLVLTQTDPSELARVLEPQIALLHEIVEAGVAAGELRTDIPPRALTLLVTHTLMASVEMNVLGTHLTGDAVSADDLWAFCTGGVGRPSG